MHGPTTLNAELATLQEQRNTLLAQAEIASLKQYLHESELIQSSVLQENWNDIVDRREYLYDTPGFGYQSADRRISTAVDRRDGQFAPFFETESDLAAIRGVSRWLAVANESGVAMLNRLSEFAIGTGFTYDVEPRKNTNPPQELLSQVEAILEETFEINRWGCGLESELFERSVYDGEFFAVVKQSEYGLASVHVVEPDYVTEPARGRDLEDWADMPIGLNWKFGVATEPGKPDCRHAYFVQWEGDSANWDIFKPSDMFHFRNNVPSNVKRGLSDFYPVSQTLERAGKLLGNTLQGAAIQACIAYIREHASGVTQGGIEAVRAGAREYQRQKPTSGGGSRTLNYERFLPGKVLDVGQGTKYTAGPLGQSNATVGTEIVQSGLRIVGNRWAMPEYLATGDASNANYASTLVAGGPFDKATQLRQERIKRPLLAICWKMLDVASKAGKFSRWGINDATELRAAVQIIATAPRVAIGDKLQDENVREIQKRNGVLSAKTWAAQADLDYDQEVANGAKNESSGSSPVIPGVPGPGPDPVKQPANPSPASNVTAYTDQRLNGAQITAAVEVLDGLASGKTASLVAVELLTAVGINDAIARRMVTATEANAKANPSPVKATAIQAALESVRTTAEAKAVLAELYP